MKRPLDRYAEKRAFTRTPEPATEAAHRAARTAAVRHPEARGAPPALRLPPRARRRAQVLGGAEGAVAGIRRQASRGRGRGPSVRLRLVRGRDSRRRSTAPATSSCGTAACIRRTRTIATRSAIARRRRSGSAPSWPNGKLNFFLRGEKLKGSFALVRTSTDKQWLLLKHKDRFASSGGDILARSRSVLTGRSLDELARGNGRDSASTPRVLAPTGPREKHAEEARPDARRERRNGARSDPQWLYEPKVDGYRVIAFVAGRHRAPAVAAGHRSDRRLPGARRRPRRPGGRSR